jgi:nucleoside-diphosphate-sugar epimerase
MKNRSRFFDVNVTGTRNVLEAALKAGVHKLVFTSSAGVYGSSFTNTITEEGSRPTPFESDYDLSKHMAEKEVKDFAARGLHATIVNPSRVYGPGPATYSNGVTRMIELLMKKKWVAFPNLDQYYSNYSFISDVVKGHIGAMEKGNPGENYILGGENISYSQFQFLLVKNAQRKSHILKIPLVLFKFLASVMEKMNSEAELSSALVDRLAKNRILSSEKAIANLGYQVTPFENGLKATINYLISCNPQT